MVKERYKDDSLNITDAGEKVKALINEHLIDLGINPKIPPNELLSDDFMAHVCKHSHGDPEAKASEMNTRFASTARFTSTKTRHFISGLATKWEKLILQHKNNWQALAEGYEALRKEALAGRTNAVEGLSKEARRSTITSCK
jgi:type I restriction enzyme R subunit